MVFTDVDHQMSLLTPIALLHRSCSSTSLGMYPAYRIGTGADAGAGGSSGADGSDWIQFLDRTQGDVSKRSNMLPVQERAMKLHSKPKPHMNLPITHPCDRLQADDVARACAQRIAKAGGDAQQGQQAQQRTCLPTGQSTSSRRHSGCERAITLKTTRAWC